ncbi:G-type lectin S-receptor-like serine/threonine-protein kinase At4g27290 isoform X2 [Alnus glutinosa]|uniref:G-type lectin S-receptor-like serine/threonine-protein kinase At4g27290 isoform X2 n=1 Tax=Alnus glutinosa TaxID=3517 RepID=UPI002D779268|nr:G-type lectin S-receptor-like serine/threonine-protein kinase At4g27290 isoform X2 [Alnus glutinosa]
MRVYFLIDPYNEPQLSIKLCEHKAMQIFSFVIVITNFLFFCSGFSNFVDTITRSQNISDGTTLASRDGSFELGFFSPGSSTNRYLGIWHKNIPVKTVVWVANRRNPIKDLSGVLMVNGSGNLVLLYQNGSVVWWANSTKEARNPIVQLLDSGNLVLRDEKEENPENCLWQSFDYPSDTLLPGMKLGWDFRTGLERRLSAWKSSDDPSPGDLSFGIEPHNYPDCVMKKGSKNYFRTGPWNGLHWSGSPALKGTQIFNISFVSNKDEVYLIYHPIKKSLISRGVLNQTVNFYQLYIWMENVQTWSGFAPLPRENDCDMYNYCGANGNCVRGEFPVCQCLQGFKPKSNDSSNPESWSQGCLRSTKLSCQDKHRDGFLKVGGLKLPDTMHTWLNTSLNLEQCRAACLSNCACMAYTNSDIRGRGSGCAIWFGDLLDIRKLTHNEQDLYIRMPASELVINHQKTTVIVIVIAVAAIAVVIGMLLVAYCIRKSRTNFREKMENDVILDQNTEGQTEDLELPLFDLSTVTDATDNFSGNNKLGEGGFGPVFRGTLKDGREIAVKRLARSSGQGLNEFKNEVILIAKLQHRNLVRLLGCCIQGEEKMLIYEYMPNRSMDFFIFDQKRAKVLGWSMRFHIICGIARGLLYLHEDSRLRIIHRDLKASNVLLDSNMNPKISDFGMARICGEDQTEGNTNRVVGTYGYMAPEYAIHGLFSVKSDVFSFGVLLLEILSGKKSRGFFDSSQSLNLIGHAWKLWREGRPLELIDTCLGDDSCPQLPQIIRCVHISLLCVQQHPEDRPNMSSVVTMLSSESSLPEPKEPGFHVGNKSLPVEYSSSSKQQSSSRNEISISLLEGR